MNEFLLVANNLQIKELHKNIEIENDREIQDNMEPNEETEKESTNTEVSQDPVTIFDRQPLVQSGRGGTCQLCGKYYAKLKQHEMVKHSGINHECPHCERRSSTPANLRIHVQSKHEGAKFLCDQCDYSASTKLGVKFHKDSKHLGKRYSCNECDMTFTQNHSLNRHKEKVHLQNQSLIDPNSDHIY